MQGVFEYLIGKRAFIDRIDLSLKKRVSLEKLAYFRVTGRKACLGPKSRYSQHVWGHSSLSGNPIHLWYGKASPFPNVPLARLTMHSERTPLTAAEILLVVTELTGDVRAVRVTCLELTFDLHHDQAALAKAIFSIAQKRKELTDDRGWHTNYVGGPDSERQIRIYQKTDDVVRVEVVLRLGSLKRLGITCPEQILLLRLVDFSRFMSFRDFDAVKFQRKVNRRVAPLWRRRIWHEYLVRLSAQEQTKEFENGYDVPSDTFTGPSAINSEIKKMQSRLTW
jgi:hypothetical protein